MLPALLFVLGVYLAACYGYGMYLLVRLMRGRRLRQTLTGLPPRQLVRATDRYELDDLTHDGEDNAKPYDAQRIAA